jgi:hypothetical protein
MKHQERVGGALIQVKALHHPVGLISETSDLENHAQKIIEKRGPDERGCCNSY